jgi:PRTRC genetic system ThiF family protein
MKIKKFVNPVHKIQIWVIGAGGTGSHIIGNLARIAKVLMELGHIGIKVICFDSSLVLEHNTGRQMFFPNEVGETKAQAIITKANRAYGLQWESNDNLTIGDAGFLRYESAPNIIITATDTVSSRKIVDKIISQRNYDVFWIDCGNYDSGGQVWLCNKNSAYPELKSSIFDFNPKLSTRSDNKISRKSCSAVEAITRQELGINQQIAFWATHYVWQMIYYKEITHKATFINLKEATIKSLKI